MILQRYYTDRFTICVSLQTNAKEDTLQWVPIFTRYV